MNSHAEFLLYHANRIVVVGPCGSGKSTFARELAEIRKLPLVHLDTVFWQPGWIPSPENAWLEKQHVLAASERWILDGTYAPTLPLRLSRAELAVHLDYPRWIYIPRLLRRIMMSWNYVRPDMAQGCPERLDLTFLSYAWQFRNQQRSAIISALASHSVPELRLSHPRDAQSVLISSPEPTQALSTGQKTE
jgi:adenylate kinase family enzyme